MPLSGEPDGILKGYSPALRLSLCWENEMLRFYDPESGEYLRNFEAEQAARERAEAGYGSCRKNWNEGTGKAEGTLVYGHIL